MVTKIQRRGLSVHTTGLRAEHLVESVDEVIPLVRTDLSHTVERGVELGAHTFASYP
jgi:hypothetical protein